MSTLSQPLGQVLTHKKSNLAPALLLILGLIVALSAVMRGDTGAMLLCQFVGVAPASEPFEP